MLLEYIKIIFNKWFAKFSIIASISGAIAFWSGYDPSYAIVTFIFNNIFFISVSFLLIASYQAWKEIKIILIEKSKNPIKYKITGYIKKVIIDINDIEKNYTDELNNIENLITEVNQELNKINFDGNIKSHINIFEQISNRDNREEEKTKEEYCSELNEYIIKLNDYPNQINTYLNTWEEFIVNDLCDLYYVTFEIEHIGEQSDKNIDIEIKLNNENRYIKELSILKNYPKKPTMPNKPKKTKKIYSELISARPEFDSFHNLNYIDAFRKYEEIEDKNLKINLRDLNVGDEVKIFEKDNFFINIADKNDIDVIIKSENSTSKINKKITWKEKESINYFEIDNL